MQSRSMDYEGPFGLAVFLYERMSPKDHPSFQSPFDLDTRRKDAERPSEEGLIFDAVKLSD